MGTLKAIFSTFVFVPSIYYLVDFIWMQSFVLVLFSILSPIRYRIRRISVWAASKYWLLSRRALGWQTFEIIGLDCWLRIASKPSVFVCVLLCCVLLCGWLDGYTQLYFIGLRTWHDNGFCNKTLSVYLPLSLFVYFPLYLTPWKDFYARQKQIIKISVGF